MIYPIINIDILKKIDHNLMARLISLFSDSMGQVFSEVEKSLISTDFDTIAFYIHRAKGSSVLVGANGINQITKEIEVEIKAKDIKKITALFIILQENYSLYEQEVSKLV